MVSVSKRNLLGAALLALFFWLFLGGIAAFNLIRADASSARIAFVLLFQGACMFRND